MAWEIGIKPGEFMQMTPAEFQQAVRGYERRWNRAIEIAAWVVMHMYAPHVRKGKKPPSVDKLLGRKTRVKD